MRSSNGGDQVDLEKQTPSDLVVVDGDRTVVVTVVVSNGDSVNQVGFNSDSVLKLENSSADSTIDVVSPQKVHLSRSTSSHELCRVCQQENEEDLLDIGCQCRGGLAKAHKSCMDAWFRTRGSNQCEICQQIAVNISPPESLPPASYWFWRVDPVFGSTIEQDRQRVCFSPLWVAFSILIGGLLLDVLISITLGISALPVNIIIGVIVILGLGTALRLAVEFCHEWNVRRVVQRGESNVNVNLGYHPAL